MSAAHTSRERVDMARAGASTMLRQGRDGGEDRLRYIEIEHGADRPPTARLRRWHESGTTR